jgi:hypothetical protein
VLTDKYIQKLIKAFRDTFPGLDDIATKTELAELRGDFNVLQTAVDNAIKRFDTFQTELLATNHRVTRLEKHTGLI